MVSEILLLAIVCVVSIALAFCIIWVAAPRGRHAGSVPCRDGEEASYWLSFSARRRDEGAAQPTP